MYIYTYAYTYTHICIYMPDDSMPTVSAGHEAHPSTTHAATESIFAFLDSRISAPITVTSSKRSSAQIET